MFINISEFDDQNTRIHIDASKEIDFARSNITALDGTVIPFTIGLVHDVNDPHSCYGQWKDPIKETAPMCGISSYQIPLNPNPLNNPAFKRASIKIVSVEGDEKTITADLSSPFSSGTYLYADTSFN